MDATPLVRPPGYEQLVISAAEAREIDSRRISAEEDRSTPTEPTEWLEDRRIEPVNGVLRSWKVRADIHQSKGSSSRTPAAR